MLTLHASAQLSPRPLLREQNELRDQEAAVSTA